MRAMPTDAPLGPVTLAIDHVKAMRACIAGEVSASELVHIKGQLAAAGQVSVLTDPEHGLQQVRDLLLSDRQLVVSVEDGDYASPQLPPRVLQGWDVAKISVAGADLVKCFFWYEPGVGGERARQFLAQVASDCNASHIPFIAEPILTAEDVSAKQHAELLVETVREIGDCGAAALKLEFPGGPEGSVELGAQVSNLITDLSPVPWYLLSQGVSFEMFQAQLAAAVSGGATGCVVGRAVWRDLVTVEGVSSEDQLTLRDRLGLLTEIVLNNGSTFSNPRNSK